MRRFVFALCALGAVTLQPTGAQTPAVTGAATPPAQSAASRASGKLPVRRVILYKSGIGYFEHVGRVSGNQTVSIDFNSAQLNDVLKSLTALDLGTGRVTGIAYNSDAPLSQQLATLGLKLGEETTVADFLRAVRGARVEVRGPGATATGRLLNVERRTIERGQQTVERDELSLVTDAGEIRTMELTPAVGIRLAERDSSEQLSRYLSLLAGARSSEQRRMDISTAGTGERDLLVSYVSEVPIWKTTYRIVLPPKAADKPQLLGWAIVDNTIGEDWQNVELALVAGAPQSFVYQLSQPLYARRPVVPLPSTALLAPQTHQGALTEPVEGGAIGTMAETVAARAPAPQRVMAAPAPPPPPSPIRSRESLVNLAADHEQPAAEAGDLGDLFEYRITTPITIAKNRSALVPILRAQVTAERVSLWNDGTGERPLRSLWLTNSSGLTLDGGAFTVIDASAFAGEGIVSPMKPDEKRLLSYATDLGVQVDAKRGDAPSQVRRLRIDRGVIIQQSEERSSRVYTVRNNDTTPRTVVLEHPIRSGWSLVDGSKPVETTAAVSRFVMQVEPKKTATLKLDEVHPLETRVGVSQLTPDQIAVYIRNAGETAALARALAPVAAKKSEIAGLQSDIAARQAEAKRIGEDQQRLRENMKALKGSADEQSLVKRYTRQLTEQEDRLDALGREIDALEQKRRQAQDELNRLIEALRVEG